MFERVRSRGQTGPLLSVIVPVYDVEAYLDECLTSILRQRHRTIEVIVVNDGTTDDSMAIARRHASRDQRIRILERTNGGLSAARNTGVEAASGDFLTFVDSDDVVTATGLADAVASLRETGSDIAVLRYGRLRDGTPARPAPWIRRLHSEPHLAFTLAQFPEVMVNATAWGKVFRRSFYDDAGLRFVEGVIYEDQAFTAAAYSAAAAIDVLPTTGYLWRVNETSMSQGQVTVTNLLGRLDAAADSLTALDGHPARADRALQQLRYNLPNSLLKLERADAAYLDTLIARVPAILDAAPAERYATGVPAQYRVLYALLRAGDRDAVWRFVRAEGMQPEMHPAGMEPGGFTVYLPGWQRDGLPPSAYVLTVEQTSIRTKVRDVTRSGGDLVIDLAVWFPHVDLTQVETELSVRTDGDVAEVAPGGEPVVVRSRQGAERRYPGSGWTVTLRGVGRRHPRELLVELVAGSFSGAAVVRLPV